MRTEQEVVRLVCEALVAAGWRPAFVQHYEAVDTPTLDEMLEEAETVEECALWFENDEHFAALGVVWQGVDYQNPSEVFWDYHTGDFGAVVDKALEPIIEEERSAWSD